MLVFVLNAGSSSLKYQLINAETTEVKASGLVERIGIDGILKHEVGENKKLTFEIAIPTHKEAIELVLKTLTQDERDKAQLVAMSLGYAWADPSFRDRLNKRNFSYLFLYSVSPGRTDDDHEESLRFLRCGTSSPVLRGAGVSWSNTTLALEVE